jgi:inositol 2-dehydrogenase
MMTVQERIRFGLIGAGRIGQVYGQILTGGGSDAELVVIADARPEAAQETAARYGIRAWSGEYRAVLDHPDVDAVVIATPTSTHVEVVKAAAAAGKQVFCEKPLALTVAGCDEAISATDSAGVTLMVGFMRRFDLAYQSTKQNIVEGGIGVPVMYKGIGRDPRRTTLEFARRASSGGLLMDMGIHDYDLARWLMGDEIVRVSVEGGCLVYPELAEVGDIDNAVVNLRFANGAIGNVDLSRNAVYGHDIRTEVLGSAGGVRVGRGTQTDALWMTEGGVAHDLMQHPGHRFAAAFTAEIRAFVRSIREGTPPPVTGADARAATAVGEAAVRSLDEGRPVMVSEVL